MKLENKSMPFQKNKNKSMIAPYISSLFCYDYNKLLTVFSFLKANNLAANKN